MCIFLGGTNLRTICVMYSAANVLWFSCVWSAYTTGSFVLEPTPINPAVRCFCSLDRQSKDWANIATAAVQNSSAPVGSVWNRNRNRNRNQTRITRCSVIQVMVHSLHQVLYNWKNYIEYGERTCVVKGIEFVSKGSGRKFSQNMRPKCFAVEIFATSTDCYNSILKPHVCP